MAPAAEAGSTEDWSVGANFDLASDSFGVASPLQVKRGQAAQTLDVGGVPLKVGTHKAVAGTGWRSVAGANARYTLPLAEALSATARAKVAKTSFVDDPTRDLLQGSTILDLRYATAGWTFDLLPGVEIASRGTGPEQRDLGLEGRAARALGGGVDLAMAGKVRWRATDGPDAPASEALSGRFGLACALPYAARLDLAYMARHELAEAGLSPPGTTEARGPSLGVSLPLGSQVAVAARYRFTETTQTLTGLPGTAYEDDRHQFGLDMSWGLGGGSDLRLLAKYTYERVDVADADTDAERHAGIVSLAMGF